MRIFNGYAVSHNLNQRLDYVCLGDKMIPHRKNNVQLIAESWRGVIAPPFLRLIIESFREMSIMNLSRTVVPYKKKTEALP